MYQLVNGTFTILTDGTRTIYNLAWVAQSLGWSTVHNDNQAPDIVMLVTNAQGGVVDTWDVGRHHFTCAGGSTVFTNPNAQNIYTVATGGYFDLKAAFYYKNC
jgi:hypothetical protein